MKLKIKRLIAPALMVLAGMVFMPAGMSMAVDCSSPSTTQQAIQCGVTGAGGNQSTTPDQATTNINNTIASVVNILSAAVGIISVIMIILAGFRYITSGGKQESVASAKNSLVYAIIGIVIVALAQVIVKFVLKKTVANG